MREPASEDASVDVAMLSFPPRKGYVALATEFVKTFCAEYTDDDEIIARAQLAAHELAENVVKYAASELCVVRVRLTHHPSSDTRASLLITTENEVVASRLARVLGYLRELEQATNPDQFYDQQIAETAKRSEGSGLGLARIRSEALMEITHRIHAGQLCVSAALNLCCRPRESHHE